MNNQVNNIMQSSPEQKALQPTTAPSEKTAADERGTVHVSGYVRIFDPSNQETLVEARE